MGRVQIIYPVWLVFSTCTPVSRPVARVPWIARLIGSLEKSLVGMGKFAQANGESLESFSLAPTSDQREDVERRRVRCARVIASLTQSELGLGKA